MRPQASRPGSLFDLEPGHPLEHRNLHRKRRASCRLAPDLRSTAAERWLCRFESGYTNPLGVGKADDLGTRCFSAYSAYLTGVEIRKTNPVSP